MIVFKFRITLPTKTDTLLTTLNGHRFIYIRITTEVGEALKVIQDALEKRTFFMTTKDYTEFSRYFIYLKLTIKNQEVYLPTPELLALAIKL
jgi:hypothetical protein